MYIGWILFLAFYIYWLLKKKPHKRTKTYKFPLCGFSIMQKVW